MSLEGHVMARSDKQQTAVVEDLTEATITKPGEEVGTKTLATVERQVPAPASTGVVAGYNVGGVGTGFEDFDQNDLVVPLMYVLQKGSPQVEEGNPKPLDGAKAGTIFNTCTTARPASS
jgi:hypothetical protein